MRSSAGARLPRASAAHERGRPLYSPAQMHAEPAHAATTPAARPRPPGDDVRARLARAAGGRRRRFLLLRLGFDQGGYFPAAYTSAGAIAFIALAVLVVRPTQERLSTYALVALGASAAFACWVGLSRIWSVVPDVPLLDMERAMLYLALFGLGLLAADSGRHARAARVGAARGHRGGLRGRAAEPAAARSVTAAVDPFVAVCYRLDHPLGYWNAFGALASLGAVLALGLAADPGAQRDPAGGRRGRSGDAGRGDVPVAVARCVDGVGRRTHHARGDRATSRRAAAGAR